MSGASPSTTWTVAELGRVLFAHRLDPALAAAVLSLSPGDTERLVGGRPLGSALDATQLASAVLLLNVLVRLEVRCCHEGAAIRAALDRPLETLGGDTLAERLLAGPDENSLAELRLAAGSMPLPKIRMWRVADTYS